MKPHLQCAGATGVTIQPHQILRLSRRKTHLYLVLHHHMKRHFTMRGATGVTIQPHQILRLPRKNDTARFQRKSPQTGETSFPMRGRSEHDPTMIRPWKTQTATRLATEVYFFELTTSIFYWKIQRFAPNLTFKPSPNTAPAATWTSPNAPATKSDTWTSPSTAPATKRDTWTSPNIAPATKSNTWTSPSTAPCHEKVTLDLHQILRLPRRKTHLLNHHHVWNLIYNAGSNRCHHPTSPNTAPATQNDSHAWSSSHMKHHFQCAEQQVSRSNLTKYCACHEKWHCKISKKISKKRWNVISNAGPIERAWSDHDPSMIRPWKRKPQPASQVRLLFQLTTSIFYCKIQRFAPNLTFKPSPNTAPATKSDTWTSPSTAPATKSDTWTSPSTAPATKSDTRTSLL